MSNAQKIEFVSLFNSDQFGIKRVAELRREDSVPVGPPCAVDLAVLDAMEVFSSTDVGGSHPQPTFLSWMCGHRDLFVECVIRVRNAAGECLLKYIFAQQNPLIVCFMELSAVAVPDVEVDPSTYFHAEPFLWDHTFMSQWRFRFSDDGLFDQDPAIDVMTHVVCVGGGRHCSDSRWQPLSALETILPRKVSTSSCAQKDEAATPASDAHTCDADEAWFQYPAMWEFVRDIDRMQKPQGSRLRIGKKRPNKVWPEHSGDHELALALLQQRRTELESPVGQDWSDFFEWHLRGGTWTSRHKGVAFDVYVAAAKRGGEVIDFIDAYPSLKRSCSCFIREYGDQVVLSCAWLGSIACIFLSRFGCRLGARHIFCSPMMFWTPMRSPLNLLPWLRGLGPSLLQGLHG